MSRLLLEVRGLYAGYGEVPVLHDVRIDIGAGEIVALVGSNGAGKTTLLRALSCVIASAGIIRFDSRELGNARPDEVFAQGLVQVPEGRQLFDQMSVEENLLMGAYRRRDDAAIAADLAWIYSLLPKLAERRLQLAGSLSGGEQQMCAIGRGLMASPKLLMIDEMSLGLAPLIVDQLLGVLGEIRKRRVTVLLVEQDVHSAFQVADRAYLLEGGRIVREGPARMLADDPEVQRAYLGV
jgi:branched-chain amino acid transport system ATP-binding protein